MNKKPSSLPKLRKQIDRLDDQIVDLLNRRLYCAKKIGSIKAANGHKVYDRSREKEVLERIARKKGVLTSSQLKSIYQAVLRASRAHQRRLLKGSK
jgi:monofunctional chorismate mutase